MSGLLRYATYPTLKPHSAPLLMLFTLWIGLITGARAEEDWPAPVKALIDQGVEVTGRFAAPGGLSGFAGRVGQQPLAIYVTADGKQAVVGTLIDAKGKNLSEEPLQRLVTQPLTKKIWKQLQDSAWIADGKDDAPHVVYVFTDPECPYCHKFWEDARPWVKSGRVQLRHVLVAILKPTSAGKAAAILSAKDPSAALAAYEARHQDLQPLQKIPQSARGKLEGNQRLMQQLGASATPAIFYRNAAGDLKSLQGAPPPKLLDQVLGPR